MTAQALYMAPGAPPLLLESYDARTDSGRMPGLGMGAAAGSAAGVAAGGAVKIATSGRAEVEAEARRVAQRLSANLGNLFVEHDWIAEPAHPSLPSPRRR